MKKASVRKLATFCVAWIIGLGFTAKARSSDVIWCDDAVPAGAAELSDGGDSWNWISSNPTPYSGKLAHQSSLSTGLHEHFFNYASSTLSVAKGDSLYAYVYLDPANPPSEIMLSWNANNWEHRAYWGANDITYGTNGTVSRQNMGALPATGQWVRLQVPAAQVGLEGQILTGMGFSLVGGRATWDDAGDGAVAAAVAPTPAVSTSSTSVGTASPVDVDWCDDAVPAGAAQMSDGGDSWNWISSNPLPFSGKLSHQSSLSAGLHEHFFNYATKPLGIGANDVLYVYVYLNPASPPTEIMLSWNANNWEHRAYWGANQINYGTNGSVSCQPMGPMPTSGQWVRLQIPASAVGLQNQSLTGMGFSQFGGQATWDRAGDTIYPAAITTSGSTTGSGSSTTSGGSTSTGSSSSTGTGSSSGSTSSSSGTTGSGSSTTTGSTSGGSTTTGSTSSGSTSSGSATGSDSSTATRSLDDILSSFNVDDTAMHLPKPGDSLLHVLSPTLLELKLINTKAADPAAFAVWNFVNNFTSTNPSSGKFSVVVNGATVQVNSVGFKRRVMYAPLINYDLRVENSLYLTLSSPVADGQLVTVTNADGTLWSSSTVFSATVDPQRYSPAIHVNEEGYVPSFPKKAMVGYYLGDMGEMPITATTFNIIDASTGTVVFQGPLTARLDSGYNSQPLPYQKVLQADFSSFTTPGEYQLQVPGMGASLPFLIDEGIAMGFARTYALGLFNQRCGFNMALPFTRFVHGADHTAPVSVPVPDTNSAYAFTWKCINSYTSQVTPNSPPMQFPQTAPALTNNETSLYPFVNTGPIDVSGGHHDAGDYSRYTSNSAELVHYLIFSVDAIPGVAQLDNIGIAESGDGIPDMLQECKWEADYLAKLQDADGGFYFLVYPIDREYESNVLPDHGDAQVVWPKNTSVTAAAVAALAECSSSPTFKKYYPAVAAQYLKQAQLGWQFLTNAISKYGNSRYQKLTFYSDNWQDNDELAWAACEMFLATGNTQYQTQLEAWFPNPGDSKTFRWGWWRMSECWGNAIRSYAFAAISGRLPATSLDANYLAACQAQVVAAGDDVVSWNQANAYGTPFPTETKAVNSAGWYFSLDQASDAAVAYQINPKPAYIDALVSAMNYEAGTNPLNVTYVTGLGLKRQRVNVSQYHENDRRVLPPTGIPLGNIQAAFEYLNNYGSTLGNASYPNDNAGTGPYPFYDRWSDAYNVTTEYIGVNQARSLMATAFLASQTPSTTGAWVPPLAQITVPTTVVPVGTPVTLTVQVPNQDLSNARIVWEARDQDPAYGPTFSDTPTNNGAQWVEVEIEWPDGRRSYGESNFTADSPTMNWVNGSLPLGSVMNADGGDAWTWENSGPTPRTAALDHQSNIASGVHEHYFTTTPQDPNMTNGMLVSSGDTMYAWVYVDPANPVTEIMVGWYDGAGWEHRVYWGANTISYGSNGSAGRYYAGPLPAAGQWVQLTVPASAVGLEGTTVSGMMFSLVGGRAAWDAAGKSGPICGPQPAAQED